MTPRRSTAALPARLRRLRRTRLSSVVCLEGQRPRNKLPSHGLAAALYAATVSARRRRSSRVCRSAQTQSGQQAMAPPRQHFDHVLVCGSEVLKWAAYSGRLRDKVAHTCWCAAWRGRAAPSRWPPRRARQTRRRPRLALAEVAEASTALPVGMAACPCGRGSTGGATWSGC